MQKSRSNSSALGAPKKKLRTYTSARVWSPITSYSFQAPPRLFPYEIQMKVKKSINMTKSRMFLKE